MTKSDVISIVVVGEDGGDGGQVVIMIVMAMRFYRSPESECQVRGESGENGGKDMKQ